MRGCGGDEERRIREEEEEGRREKAEGREGEVQLEELGRSGEKVG